MDSEDSRDASSGNESDDKEQQSPSSTRSRSRESNVRSNRSPSRSTSPPSIHQSLSPQSRPISPDSPPLSPQNGIPSSRKSSDAHSAGSGSSSSDDEGSHSRSRPHTPKSLGSASYHSGDHKSRTPSPGSPASHRSSRSPSPNINEPPPIIPRSPTPHNSSRSSSPGSPVRAATKTPVSDNENASIKSESSHSSKKSRSSRVSDRSSSTQGSRRSRGKSNDGNSSDSSESSVDSSSRRNKNITKNADTQPEEISDGDMESDNEKEEENVPKENNVARPEINISHEDLSDVSDLEDCIGDNSDDDNQDRKDEENMLRENSNNHLNEKSKSASPEPKKVVEKNNRTEEGEEQLDFEAEDGECGEIEPSKDEAETEKPLNVDEAPRVEEPKEDRELEEGEVTDEDDARPEETEPRPVCRFFSRGQCTWGASCRFLHPGVTDKGNYTMFELIRPVVPGEFGRDERLYGKTEPPLVESAWERGLRTAKEMLRKSVKRKEQDIDFEEKKMNLSLAQEEFDKENGYYGRVPSPEPRYVRHVPVEYPVARPPEEYYGRRQVLYEPEYAPPPRERVRSYRELPSHRMPDYYNSKYEEEPQTSAKRPRPKREVIVQRVEERQGRGDEWSDPWMRSKSPGRRKESGRKRSYSSGSSYSSSSSSRSSSETSRSSYRSRSRSPQHKRTSRSGRSRQISPSVIVSERKAANERAALMNPPAPKRRAPSPGMMRVSGAANPPAPSREDQFGRSRSKLAVAAALARVKGRRRSSRSSSGSSGSSSSDSDSSDSSSSTSRAGSSPPRRPAGMDISIAKAMDALKGGSAEKKQIKLNLKNPVGIRKPDISDLARKPDSAANKKRPANSPPPGDPKSKKATSRREELLKQLKAVEDAIAKKRSKVN